MAQEEAKDTKPSTSEKPNPSTETQMATSSASLSVPAPSWFTPKRYLFLLFALIL